MILLQYVAPVPVTPFCVKIGKSTFQIPNQRFLHLTYQTATCIWHWPSKFDPSSPKRNEELREFQKFLNANEERLLKHSTIRWLSLGRCIERLLSQFEAVKSYFSSQPDAEKPRSKVGTLLSILQDPLCLPWLQFVQAALLPYYSFNKQFQVGSY